MPRNAKPATPLLEPPRCLWQHDAVACKAYFSQRLGIDESWPLIGCDEVGRGSLIGPVVAGAVQWRCLRSAQADPALARLTDSKKLTATHRQALLPVIQHHAWWGIGEASVEEITELNILQASLLAMHRAIHALQTQKIETSEGSAQAGVLLLVDGSQVLPQYPTAWQQTVVQGDSRSSSIAAASILAKEYRDAWVRTVADAYPAYGWHTNMGYATAQHRQAIADVGLTPLHRPSFKLKNRR